MVGSGSSSGLCQRCVGAEKVYWERGVGEDELIPSLIVWAIAEGRKMAAGIDKYLQAGKSAKKSVS